MKNQRGADMGGAGSTRWRFHNAAVPVEDCIALSVFDLRGKIREAFGAGGHGAGFGVLRYSRSSEIAYILGARNGGSYVRLLYAVTMPRSGIKVSNDYTVELQTTTPYFGGTRYWLTCPIEKDGVPCSRRVGKLWLPPGALRFGCRQCHKLTYRSSQESDARASALRKLAAVAMAKRLGGGVSPTLFYKAKYGGIRSSGLMQGSESGVE